jgi:hypothetical protein
VRLYRCFAWNRRAKPADPDGPLWFPRSLQGEGRHDNPDLYGCLYLSERDVSSVVEQLARFRSQRLTPSLLRRRELPLAIATLELAEPATLIDLDDPKMLLRSRLRPSVVATRQRARTQPQARALFERLGDTDGLRWWSTYEAAWINVTIFDRAAGRLRVESVRELSMTDVTVIEASEFLGLIAKARLRS